MTVLLDTHSLLWWVSDPSRLSAGATRAIARADAVLVSPISLWEVSTLVRMGRIELDRDTFAWTRDLLGTERVEIAAITPTAAVMAGELPDDFPGDPADRLLYATAVDAVAPLVSKDGRLRRYARHAADVKVVW